MPIQGAAIRRYTGFPPEDGVELGRFVLLPEVPFNGETWFLRRAFTALRLEKGGPGGVRSIISYADPLERALPLVATRVRHPGNHGFAFGLDDDSKRQVLIVNDGGRAYPRVGDRGIKKPLVRKHQGRLN